MDKEQKAIMRLQEASKMSFQIYKQPLVVTDSGGKDSSVCVELAKMAGIPFEVMHNHTTADAPETVYFIREKFKRLEAEGVKCSITYPNYKGMPTSMWDLIPQKMMPPTMIVRYCCDVLKESHGAGRFIATGVRWDESRNRRNNRGIYETLTTNMKNKIILNNDNDDRRRLFESCAIKAKRVCNPIVDWSDRDVWDYLRSERIQVNPLYQCGFDRVGCIGCPMARRRKRTRDFRKWPKYKTMYIKAFDRMLEARRQCGKMDREWRSGNTGEEVFHWWMDDGVLPGQIGFDDIEELDEE